MADNNLDPKKGAENKSQSPVTDIKIDFNPAASNSNSTAKNDIFSSIGAKSESKNNNNLVENISSQKELNSSPSLKSILGNSSMLEKSLQQEQELSLRKKSRIVQTLFAIVFIAFLLVQGFFYYELSPGLNLANVYTFSFDQNLNNKIGDINKNLRSVQTLINKYNYLSAQLYLNEFSFLSGKFIDGVSKLNSNDDLQDKTTLQSDIEDAKTKLPEILTKIKKVLTVPFVVELYPTTAGENLSPEEIQTNFENDLRIAFTTDKKDLLKAASTPTSEQIEGAKFIDNASKLVGNQKLLTALKNFSAENFKKDLDAYEKGDDPVQKKKIQDYIATVLSSTRIDLATITSIKNTRIEWASIIDKIKNITDTVNNEHNAGTQNESTFTYSGYEFNSDANTIILSGINTTKGGTNTSVMSNLIDSFEASPYFENVTNRSFPKAKSMAPTGETNYTMNFKIDLGLEKDQSSIKNAPIALKLSTQKLGVKRKK